MKYLLFEKNAIEIIIRKTDFQSIEYCLGKQLIDIILEKDNTNSIDQIVIRKCKHGLIFAGAQPEKKIIVFDLVQSRLLEKEKDESSLLLILQKVFRTAIRIWNKQPFTSSERIHESKSIIFPFVFTDRRRIVLERAVECERLSKRGIEWPLLVYKYGTEDAPRTEEIAKIDVIKNAGEEFIEQWIDINNEIRNNQKQVVSSGNASLLVEHSSIDSKLENCGFMYIGYKCQLEKLTLPQKRLVNNNNFSSPIRIEGPAGTGKTASMILRAYRILMDKKNSGDPFKIVFFSYSETTRCENEYAFLQLENSAEFLNESNPQFIIFTTLFSYCIIKSGIKPSCLIEEDAINANQMQRLLIEEAFKEISQPSNFRAYQPFLSQELKEIVSKDNNKVALISMLQHEFSIQIKGRTDCTIDEYYAIPPITNGLPTKNKRDKEFVFSIFKQYQQSLRSASVYDSDDIIIQALSILNAPIWRRERVDNGFDYIFVDEMHLFNINEQHVFHFLTKDNEMKEIPICFALDYSQAVGDRGDTKQDYIEKGLGEIDSNSYNTVFRSSPQITDFCAAIAASGALMFQSSFIDPYKVPISGFTEQEEKYCEIPKLYMYDSDDSMIASLKEHIDNLKQALHCNNSEIAIISFDEKYLEQEKVEHLELLIGRKLQVLKDRHSYCSKTSSSTDSVFLCDSYSINGLEFKSVILIGVDEGRVPQNIGVNDICLNYIRFIAFNKLYLASSRAKYRLILIGNRLNGDSSCLEYALSNQKIEKVLS